MKRILWILMPVVVVAMAAPVFAGDYDCTASTQECLDKMAAKLKDKGWMGVHLDDAEGKMVISKVIEDSPAEKAGLETGDVFFALNGIEYGEENMEKMKKVQKTMNPGKTFALTVLRDGNEKDIEITLGTLPDDVLAQWVGHHMLDHAEVENVEED